VVQPGPPNSVGECHRCKTLVCSKCRPAHRCRKPSPVGENVDRHNLLPKLMWSVRALGEETSDADPACSPEYEDGEPEHQ
jgi:hypothetical protein